MTASVQRGRVFALSILAGLIAGGILAALNLVALQPYINLLADDIIDELIADGEFDEEEFDAQARTVFLAQTAGSAAIGIAAGSLIGGVLVFAKRDGGIAEALLIAGIAWFVLYAMPAAKYPPSPVAMFNGDAAAEYYPLYVGYLALSGLSALGVVAGFRKVAGRNKYFGMAAVYLVIVAIAYFVFPSYERDSTFDQASINSWRAMSSATTAIFWFSAGGIAGLLIEYGSSRKNYKKIE
jgi:hypothetical protein